MPFRYYLNFLITLGLSTKKIISKMRELGFDVNQKQVDNAKKGMMLPKIFEKYNNNESVDEKYLFKYAKRFNIKELWRYELTKKPKAVEEMMCLVKDKNARLIPVILTIKGDNLVHDSMKELGYEYSKKAIDLMLHYFFNIKKMNFAGWKKFFEDNVPKAAELLDQPLNYIRYKFGLNPRKDYTSILQDIMHLTYFKSKEHLTYDDKENVSIAKKLADLAIKAGEKLEKYGDKNEKNFLEDIKIEFESANMEFKGAEKISDEEAEEGPELDLM